MHKALISIFFCSFWPSFLLAQVIDTLQGDSFSAVQIVATKDRVIPVYKVDSLRLNEVNGSMFQLDEALQSKSLHLRNYGPGQLTSVSLRGTSSAQTTVYWNGISLNSSMLGQADLSVIPMAGVNEAEIRYGNANKQDGFGSLGGSINLRSSFNQPEKIVLTSSVGSFEDYRGSGNASYRVSQKIRMKTGVSLTSQENNYPYSDYTTSDSQEKNRENAKFKQFAFNHHIELLLKEGQSIQFHGLFSDSYREIPTVIGASSRNDQNQSDQLALATVKYLKTTGFWKVNAQVAFKQMLMNYYNEQSGINENYTMHAWQANLSARRMLTNRLVLKLNSIVLLDDVASDVYSEQRLSTRIGAELGYAISKQASLFMAAQPELLNDSIIGWLPTIGFTAAIPKLNLSTKGSWSKNARVPTFNDLYWIPGGNSNLKPEFSEMAELGLSGTYKWKRLTFNPSATVFYAEIDDLLVWVPSESGYSEAVNSKFTTQKGIELSLDWSMRLAKHLTFHSNSEATVLNALNEINQELIYVPKQEIISTNELNWKHHQLQVRYQYVSSRFIDLDNNWYLPAYDLLDLAYQINLASILKKKHSLYVAFEALNVLDKSYMVLAGRPMPGRSFRISLKYALI